MMKNSDRSEFIAGNISPQLKRAIFRYIELRKDEKPRMSLSRTVEKALQEMMEREGVVIEPTATELEEELLPFFEGEEHDKSAA